MLLSQAAKKNDVVIEFNRAVPYYAQARNVARRDPALATLQVWFNNFCHVIEEYSTLFGTPLDMTGAKITVSYEMYRGQPTYQIEYASLFSTFLFPFRYMDMLSFISRLRREITFIMTKIQDRMFTMIPSLSKTTPAIEIQKNQIMRQFARQFHKSWERVGNESTWYAALQETYGLSQPENLWFVDLMDSTYVPSHYLPHTTYKVRTSLIDVVTGQVMKQSITTSLVSNHAMYLGWKELLHAQRTN